MSRRNERRAEKEAEWAREQEAREKERYRKEALSMYYRIQESDASEDVKDILQRIAEAAGVDIYKGQG